MKIKEKTILYLAIILQSLLGLALHYTMSGPAKVGYAAMMIENEAYELGIMYNEIIVSGIVGLMLLIFIEAIVYLAIKNIARYLAEHIPARREIPRRKHDSTRSL